MREAWTGELIGRMYNAEVTQEDLAKEMKCTKSYVSRMLNGTRTPKGGRERCEAAFANIIARRKEAV